MKKAKHNKTIIEDLGDGLILRRSTIADRKALADFNGKLHADPGEDFAEHLSLWVKDLLSGKHPTFNVGDFTIVEDTKTGKIVSSLNLIDQTWSFGGIKFDVGRIELVGTVQEYRRRGLVRKQMDLVHQWSEERGQKLQAITGIPWYYRQFGYEMTVNLGGGRSGFIDVIPTLKKGQKEIFKIRKAQEKDIPFIKKLYDQAAKRHSLSCERDIKSWKYEISVRNKKSATTFIAKVIENDKGKLVGFLFHGLTVFSPIQSITSFEIIESLSWLEVTFSVLRHMKKLGETNAKKKGNEKQNAPSKFNMLLGEDHPSYHILLNKAPQHNPPYAWYLRVPDVVGFLNHISPILEERLAKSYLIGHTGELKLNFFTSGAIMQFKKGKIKIKAWAKPTFEDSDANFPDLSFLKILFGHRSYEELFPTQADLYASGKNPEARPLLESLFIRKPSNIVPID